MPPLVMSGGIFCYGRLCYGRLSMGDAHRCRLLPFQGVPVMWYADIAVFLEPFEAVEEEVTFYGCVIVAV